MRLTRAELDRRKWKHMNMLAKTIGAYLGDNSRSQLAVVTLSFYCMIDVAAARRASATI